jgi:hypothetical protein
MDAIEIALDEVHERLDHAERYGSDRNGYEDGGEFGHAAFSFVAMGLVDDLQLSQCLSMNSAIDNVRSQVPQMWKVGRREWRWI